MVLLRRALGVPWLHGTTSRGHNVAGGCPVLGAPSALVAAGAGLSWIPLGSTPRQRCPSHPSQVRSGSQRVPRERRPSWDRGAMSSVHYKFSSKLSYDVVTFHGHSISLGDLKRQIMARERLKAANCDLQILKAETSEGEWGLGPGPGVARERRRRPASSATGCGGHALPWGQKPGRESAMVHTKLAFTALKEFSDMLCNSMSILILPN